MVEPNNDNEKFRIPDLIIKKEMVKNYPKMK
jgi:hypothetical protein